MRPRDVLLALVGLIALYTLMGCAAPDQAQPDQRQPDQAQPLGEKPTLETATLYVAGSNGGAYKVSWFVWTPKGDVLHKGRKTAVIKEEPTAYSIDLEGFSSDRNKGFFLGNEEIDVEANKTEPWKGVLVIVLIANDTLVECETMRETHPRAGGIDFEFDADSRKDYKEKAACADVLEL
jgi:hypothetical protein